MKWLNKFLDFLKSIFIDVNPMQPPDVYTEVPSIVEQKPTEEDKLKLLSDIVVSSLIDKATSYNGERETNGNNRSPFIDMINKWIGVALGSPYCATGISYCLTLVEKALGVKFAIKKTASSQSMWFDTPVEYKILKPKRGAIGIMYNIADPNYGHVVLCLSEADANGNFNTFEFNTNSAGSRDGEGSMFSTRNIKGDSRKRFRGYIDTSIAFKTVITPIMPRIDFKDPNWDEIAKFMKLDTEVNKLNYLSKVKNTILANKQRYLTVEHTTGVPWKLIAAIHFMEASSSFSKNLMNGQPLNQVTTIVPKGKGPWKDWESSAIEAMGYDGLAGKPNGYWTLGKMLALAEKYNGLGYRSKGILSPYVTAYTNMSEEKGGYPKDHVYDPNYVHSRPSVGAILLSLKDV